MSWAEDIGLSVHAYTPLVRGGGWLSQYANILETYTHTIAANGGYMSATINMKMDEPSLDEWVYDGLARHIEAYNQAQQVVFEGFVNQLTATIGTLRVTRGPLLNIANRAWARYTPLDTTANPPAKADETVTTAVQDATSQASYGIIELCLSAGEATEVDAEQTRDTHLEEHKDPETTHDIGEPADPSLQLEIVGYYEWLKAIYYQDVAASGTVTIGQKLQDVLTAARAVNAWQVSADYTDMDANAVLSPNYENDDKTCKQVADELTAVGDAADNRYTFGLYASRKPYYKVMPTTCVYQHRVKDNGPRIFNMVGNEIRPWDVLPARWVFLSDFLPGLGSVAELRKDIRYAFIEQVTYTAPYGIQLTGNKVDTSKQLVARLGLGGSAA
jgi:hypothetical protein